MKHFVRVTVALPSLLMARGYGGARSANGGLCEDGFVRRISELPRGYHGERGERMSNGLPGENKAPLSTVCRPAISLPVILANEEN
uniref:Putative secreted protein n=1 Tax=Anopheles darlingi TaxID=43151 RepID=A0A2M4D8P5_ANODA